MQFELIENKSLQLERTKSGLFSSMEMMNEDGTIIRGISNGAGIPKAAVYFKDGVAVVIVNVNDIIFDLNIETTDMNIFKVVDIDEETAVAKLKVYNVRTSGAWRMPLFQSFEKMVDSMDIKATDPTNITIATIKPRKEPYRNINKGDNRTRETKERKPKKFGNNFRNKR